MRGDRLPLRRRPGDAGQQALQQGVALLRVGNGREFFQCAAVGVASAGHCGVHPQLATTEQAMQQALVQRPRLDPPQRHAAADPRQQTALHGEAALGFAQMEAVVLGHRQGDRQRAHGHQQGKRGEGHQRCHDRDAGMDLADVAIGQLAVMLDEVGHRTARNHLVDHAKAGRHHHHAAIGDQAQPDDLGHRQAQQAAAVFFDLRRRHACVACTAPYQIFQRQRLIQPQHAHFRFRLVPTGRFQPHLGHAGQTVQQRLMHHHVMDARKRDIAPAAFQQATANGHAIAADAVAVGEVAQHRNPHQHRNHHAGGDLVGNIAIAVAAAEQDQCG